MHHQRIQKFWLNYQLASFEALLSREKTIDDPTPSCCSVPFSRLVAQKRYPSKVLNCLGFPYHIGRTVPVKEFSWSRNSAFWVTEKRPRRTSRPPQPPAAPSATLTAFGHIPRLEDDSTERNESADFLTKRACLPQDVFLASFLKQRTGLYLSSRQP